MPTTSYRDADLVAITYNTHMGMALSDILWLLRRMPRTSLIFLQEVPNIHVLRSWMREHGLLEDWRIVPGHQKDGERGLPFILAKRRRYRLLYAAAPRISFGSKHDRARTTAILRDTRTGRLLYLGDVHPDPLGQGFVKAHRGARRIHEAQVNEYVEWFRDAPEDAVLIAAGDFNESLDDPIQSKSDRLGRRTATQRFATVGLEPAWRATGSKQVSRSVRLDDFFIGADPFARLKRRQVLDPPSPHGDHPAVGIVLRVRAVKPD